MSFRERDCDVFANPTTAASDEHGLARATQCLLRWVNGGILVIVVCWREGWVLQRHYWDDCRDGVSDKSSRWSHRWYMRSGLTPLVPFTNAVSRTEIGSRH